MKKYRLNKLRTPDDFPVGTIAEITSNGYTTIKDPNDETIVLKNNYGSHWVEDFPEYWDYVPEATYEILAFKKMQSPPTYWVKDKQLKGQYSVKQGEVPFRPLEFFLSNSNIYKIQSIKRLSDGKIFSVDDRITCGNSPTIEKIYKISISKSNGGVYIDTENYVGHPFSFISKVAIQVEQGQQYKHENGNIYTVILLTNLDSTEERKLRHPVDVVYMGQNGKVWSRRLSDWSRSFTKVEK